MHQQTRVFAIILRITAAVIFIAATTLVALPPEIRGRDPRIAEWTAFLISLGAVAALLGLASLIRREAAAPPEVSSALSRIQQQLMDLQQRINDLDVMTDRSHRSSQATTLPLKDYTAQLDKLAAQLEEVREISLLPDAERRQRVQMHRQQRKATLIKDVFGLVAAHDWPKAERLLITLETEFPNDNEVAKGRSYLSHSRKLFEDEALVHAVAEVEELAAAGSWDRALERREHLVEGFPDSGDAQTLLSRVQKEHEIYRETTVQRMFEEIRHDIDRRIWRRALMHAERLLEQFPEHRLADRIREQLSTLQDNAEIEERQELEVRIQELIRSGRFDEAIELAEDVIRRFPVSPQAESLETLLPRIRELSRQGIAEFEALGNGSASGPAEAPPPPPANPFRSDGPTIQQPTTKAPE